MGVHPDQNDIVPPDPRVRTAAITVTAAGLVVGIFLLSFVGRYVAGLEDLVQQNPEEAARRIGAAIRVLTWAAAVPPVAGAVTMASIAIRAWRAERYPPPGARPIRSVRIRTGPAARRLAALAGALALMLLGATVVLFATLRDIERWLVTLRGM
jgi:hypothetical protein